MTPALLHALRAAQAARRAVVLATRLTDGAQWLLPDPAAPPELAAAAEALRTRGAASVHEAGGVRWFLSLEAPPARLLIVGAVHIAQSLAAMAHAAGFAPTVIDPRAQLATESRFPGIPLLRLWPDAALDALTPDAHTAVVVLSHDPKLDDPALDRALGTPAFYIGALGSRRSHAARIARLAAAGHAPAALARIEGPAGVAIGAATAGEIAVSILAGVIRARRTA